MGLSIGERDLDGRLGRGSSSSLWLGWWTWTPLLVPFQQHKRQQPLPSPGPCWTFAPVTWSSPSAGPPKVMARLLDIAILTGNQKAAANLSDNCQFRPLRRWATDWVNADDWEALWAAVWAGADFQGLVVKQLYEAGFAEETPFLQALFLDSLESKLEIWKEMIDRHLLPVCRELWRPSSDNRLGDLFWEERHGQGVFGKLSIDKIQACKNAGLDLLQFCNCRVTWRNVVTNSIDRSRRCVGATLLDMAIWGARSTV